MYVCRPVEGYSEVERRQSTMVGFGWKRWHAGRRKSCASEELNAIAKDQSCGPSPHRGAGRRLAVGSLYGCTVHTCTYMCSRVWRMYVCPLEGHRAQPHPRYAQAYCCSRQLPPQHNLLLPITNLCLPPHHHHPSSPSSTSSPSPLPPLPSSPSSPSLSSLISRCPLYLLPKKPPL